MTPHPPLDFQIGSIVEWNVAIPAFPGSRDPRPGALLVARLVTLLDMFCLRRLLTRLTRLLAFCLVVSGLCWPGPLLASIHAYPLAGDESMVRSLQHLRDRQDRAWQVVMFKQLPPKATPPSPAGKLRTGLAGFNGGAASPRGGSPPPPVHLRLVGYPGAIALNHPADLAIVRQGAIAWTATDVTPDIVGQNVGEYDFTQILPQITSNAPLWLQVPVFGKPVELTIPPFIVQEWRELEPAGTQPLQP